MTRVLIVDDSPSDSRLVGTLLQDHADPEHADYQCEYAEDGRAALRVMEVQLPDVVISDLVMPVMDGLELVAAVHDRFPSVPVIIMTSMGTDDIALNTLRQGAASYVPKNSIATDMLDTVERVLTVSRRRQSQTWPTGLTQSSCNSFVLECNRDLIAPTIGFFQDQLEQKSLCSEAERTRIGIALDEALANALYHGNLELSSDLREQDYEGYYKLVEQRCQEAPYCDRLVYVEMHLSQDELRFIIRDEGPGFDPALLPDATNAASLDKVTGRGILLMRTFMDEVLFSEAGNEVTLVKRRSREEDAGVVGDEHRGAIQ